MVSALKKPKGAQTFKGFLNEIIKFDKTSGTTFLQRTVELL